MGKKKKKLSTNMQCLIIAVAVLVIAWLFIPPPTEGEIIEDEPPPLSGVVSISFTSEDATEIIQNALLEAAGRPVVFENPGANDFYTISGTLVIPSDAVIDGNGATILIDNTNGELDFLRSGSGWAYDEYAVMTAGVADGGSGQTGALKIENLNFAMFDNDPDSQLPGTLFGMGYVESASITGCSFTVYSEGQRSMSAFDAYTAWNDVGIKNCSFTVLTDAPEGGVFFRDEAGENCSGLVIENCKFIKRGGGEALSICGSGEAVLDSVTVTGCDIIMELSEYNNPTHLIRIGNAGKLENVTFENNEITADAVVSSLFFMAQSSGSCENLNITGNTIVVKDVLSIAGYLFTSSVDSITGSIKDNYITVNTVTGRLKNAVFGKDIIVEGNTFGGNGFNTITTNILKVYGNTVEQCENGFEGFDVCSGNTIEDCVEALIIINGAAATGVRDARALVVIESNSIRSTTEGGGIAYCSSSVDFCDILIKGNIFENVNVDMEGSGRTVTMVDNIFK